MEAGLRPVTESKAAMTQTPRGFDSYDQADTPAAPEHATTGLPREDTPAATSAPARTPAEAPTPEPAPATTAAPAPTHEARQVTRAGMVWTVVAVALVVLILLIVFILQNQDYVQVKYFGLTGAVPLGVALFIAAVGGGVLVAIAGAARIIQLRLTAHRQRTRLAGKGTRDR